MSKLIIIESQDQKIFKQIQVILPYNYEKRELSIGPILNQIINNVLNQNQSYNKQTPNYIIQIFVYNSYTTYFHFLSLFPLKPNAILDEDYIQKNQIFIKIKSIPLCDEKHLKQQTKSKRINNRKIIYILEKVAEWRKIIDFKNINAQEAAQQVAIPKKTLDDYYYHIKIGQEFGFDFEMNYQENIGVLRKFVKDHKYKSQKKVQILEKMQEGLSQ